MQNYNAESRLRAIAMNAIREAVIVYGRWDNPFTDDDAARMDNIFQLLHLQNQTEYEHAPLVEEKQAPIAPQIAKVADILGNEYRSNPIAADTLGEAAPVKVSLPKAVQKPER